VGGVEGGGDRVEQAQRLGPRQAADLRQVIVEGRPGDQLHHLVRAAVGQLAEPQHPHDPGVGDRAGRPSLAHEPRAGVGVEGQGRVITLIATSADSTAWWAR
jgi:hypothetical protein